MNYNEIYWKLFLAFAGLVALYFLIDKEEPESKDPENPDSV